MSWNVEREHEHISKNGQIIHSVFKNLNSKTGFIHWNTFFTPSIQSKLLWKCLEGISVLNPDSVSVHRNVKGDEDRILSWRHFKGGYGSKSTLDCKAGRWSEQEPLCFCIISNRRTVGSFAEVFW